jgi:hypothetical protein
MSEGNNMRYFTKQEAIGLLGETVHFRADYFEVCDDGGKLWYFKAGESAEIRWLQQHPEGITVEVLLTDDDIFSLTKDAFERYCHPIDASREVRHACAG